MADREMTREEAIRILDEVIPPPDHHTVDLDHLRIAQAWAYTRETLKANPIRHGRWIKNEDRSGWHCSCCGKDDLYAYPYTENNERELQDFYCPNCGVRMDEVENDQRTSNS